MYSFLWVIVLAMLIMSVVLLAGKGSGLIAGYNTSSAEKRSKFHEKKLCHIMGVGLLILTIFSIIGAYIYDKKISNNEKLSN